MYESINATVIERIIRPSSIIHRINMIPKSLLSLMLFCLLSMTSIAQSVHEVKFIQNDIKYKGLIVENEDEKYMRFRFTDTDKKVRLVQLPFSVLEGTTNGKPYRIIKAESVRFVSKKGETDFPALSLVFAGSSKIPFVFPDLGDKKNKIKASHYRKLEEGKVTEGFLRQYFYSKEKELKMLKELLEVGEANANPYRFVTLHLVIAANTKITDIGAGCQVDKKNVTKEFETIAKTLGITLKKYYIVEDNFTKTKTLATLNGLSPNTNDIIVFLYRGHGFRYSDQSETWPQMDLRSSSYSPLSKKTSLGFMEAFNIVRKKGARLNIALADCCNNDIGINRKSETTLDELAERGSYDVLKLRELFLESKGNIISCAASPGEYSWVNTKKGGFYTLSFIQALRQEAGNKNKGDVAWKNIMNTTIKKANVKIEKCRECTKQTGKFYSNVK